jgi:hypothetical protein
MGAGCSPLLSYFLERLVLAISLAKVNTNAHAANGGDRVFVFGDVTLDNSYPTGGYAITPATLGLSAIDLFVATLSPVAGAVNFTYNYSTGALQAFQNTGAETANATDTHTCTGRFVAIGVGFATYGNAVG